ncbi:PREDICTED: collagen alpha-1(I) chain-like [Ipomoea nil]|uniref:collagen alpha-1(I) chain-like n=1 Tax=Ipomoea nil TaxID=35883 RepID=UPI0009019A67|nr:PREDICTED: collagen alpha-1(I) chain-like [Ipomoea nil]
MPASVEGRRGEGQQTGPGSGPGPKGKSGERRGRTSAGCMAGGGDGEEEEREKGRAKRRAAATEEDLGGDQSKPETERGGEGGGETEENTGERENKRRDGKATIKRKTQGWRNRADEGRGKREDGGQKAGKGRREPRKAEKWGEVGWKQKSEKGSKRGGENPQETWTAKGKEHEITGRKGGGPGGVKSGPEKAGDEPRQAEEGRKNAVGPRGEEVRRKNERTGKGKEGGVEEWATGTKGKRREPQKGAEQLGAGARHQKAGPGTRSRRKGRKPEGSAHKEAHPNRAEKVENRRGRPTAAQAAESDGRGGTRQRERAKGQQHSGARAEGTDGRPGAAGARCVKD